MPSDPVREQLKPGDLFQGPAGIDLALCVERPQSSEPLAAIVFGMHIPVLWELGLLEGPLKLVPGHLKAEPLSGTNPILDLQQGQLIEPGWLIDDPQFGQSVLVRDALGARTVFHAYGLRSGRQIGGNTVHVRYWPQWHPQIVT